MWSKIDPFPEAFGPAAGSTRSPLDEAPDAYRYFQEKSDGMVEVLFHP
jgi:hypothetical protein